MKKLKIFSAIAACTMALTMLAGCGVPANSVHGKNDLPGKTIGVQLGTTGANLADEVKNDDASTEVEKFSKGADAVQALKQGKVDAVIIDYEPAKAFTEKNDDIEILDEDLTNEDYAIALKLGNEDLQEKINGALKELKDDGTLDKIKNNYCGGESYEYKTPEGTKRENGTLIMATNAEFPPYESKEGSNIVGLDVDMMQAVCDKLGYELKIEDMAFDSIIPAIQSGKANVGVAGMTVTEDRKKNVLFSDPYTTSRQVIIVRKK